MGGGGSHQSELQTMILLLTLHEAFFSQKFEMISKTEPDTDEKAD